MLRDETILDAPPNWVRHRLQPRLRDDGLHAESAASFEQDGIDVGQQLRLGERVPGTTASPQRRRPHHREARRSPG